MHRHVEQKYHQRAFESLNNNVLIPKNSARLIPGHMGSISLKAIVRDMIDGVYLKLPDRIENLYWFMSALK